VSRAAAEGYVTALNWLLERDGDRRHRQAVPLGDGTVLVYWTREPHPVVDAVPQLLDEVAELVAAPWRTGRPQRGVESTAFYAAVLGTNRTRVVVRDWIETAVADLCASLDAYAEDLRLDEEAAPVPTIGALLRASGDAAPGMGARLFRAAIRGGPFPRELLATTLRALYVSKDRVALRARCALIKAVLVRLPRSGNRVEVPVSLDEKKTDIPYLLGRLFAVLEQMQWAAHGATVSASVRDRYHRAAASAPAMVFPRLLDLSVHHATKIARRGRGSYLEIAKTAIVDALPPERFPRTLSLEDQGLFAIGYYHQRRRLFQRAEASAPAATNTAAPEVAPRDAPAARAPGDTGLKSPRKETARTKLKPAKVPARARTRKRPAKQGRIAKRRSARKET
jgi:CRISPR-associated protein Csd1